MYDLTIFRSCTLAALLALDSLFATAVHALDPGTTDPRAILRAAADPQGVNKLLLRMRITVHAGKDTRERIATMRSKRFDAGRKSLLLIEEPADMRNTGFLSIDYKSRDKVDEQWLYLPNIHRVTRVPATGKADAFVGSDFSYSDLSGNDPDDFDVKLIETAAKVGDDTCWLIESVPRSDKIKREIGYQKLQSWISKRTLVAVRIKLWSTVPERIKYLTASDIRAIDGLWTPHRIQMRTLDKGALSSETTIDVLKVDTNAEDVTDADFTQQRLEHGV